MRTLILAVLLLALPAYAGPLAGYLPKSAAELTKGSASTNEEAAAINKYYQEWSRGAEQRVNDVANNHDVQRKVGEPLTSDREGLMCALYREVLRGIRATRVSIANQFRGSNVTEPAWLSRIHSRAQELVRERCDNKPDGKGGLRVNLGARYIDEAERLGLLRATQGAAGLGVGLGAAGGAASTATPLILVDPERLPDVRPPALRKTRPEDVL